MALNVSILLLLPGVAAAYVLLNMIAVAWLSRHARLWLRRAKRAVHGELDSLSSARMWVTTASHMFAVSAVVVTIRRPLELLELALVLLGYVFFVIALTISLMAQLQSMRKLWDDPFFKVCTLGLPFPLAFVAKGFASEWIGELTGLSAVNFPMAYAAATSFLLLLVVLIGLSVTLLVFEVLFIVTMFGTKEPGPAVCSKETLAHVFSTSERQTLAVRRWSSARKRRVGVIGISLWTFIACLFGTQALAVLLSSRVGNVLLLATAFEFDGAPANRCELHDAERQLVERGAPVLKAVFLSTAQDKALLMKRGAELFSPALLAKMGRETDAQRSLTIGRVVKCYEPKD